MTDLIDGPRQSKFSPSDLKGLVSRRTSVELDLVNRYLQKCEGILIQIIHGQKSDGMIDEHHTKEQAANLFGDLVTIDNDPFQSAQTKSVADQTGGMDEPTLSRGDDHDWREWWNQTWTCTDASYSWDWQ